MTDEIYAFVREIIFWYKYHQKLDIFILEFLLNSINDTGWRNW